MVADSGEIPSLNSCEGNRGSWGANKKHMPIYTAKKSQKLEASGSSEGCDVAENAGSSCNSLEPSTPSPLAHAAKDAAKHPSHPWLHPDRRLEG